MCRSSLRLRSAKALRHVGGAQVLTFPARVEHDAGAARGPVKPSSLHFGSGPSTATRARYSPRRTGVS
jgi:hypothetical protein